MSEPDELDELDELDDCDCATDGFAVVSHEWCSRVADLHSSAITRLVMGLFSIPWITSARGARVTREQLSKASGLSGHNGGRCAQALARLELEDLIMTELGVIRIKDKWLKNHRDENVLKQGRKRPETGTKTSPSEQGGSGPQRDENVPLTGTKTSPSPGRKRPTPEYYEDMNTEQRSARACEGPASDRDGPPVRLNGPALTDPPGDGGPRPPWGLGSSEARAICAEIGLGEYDLKQLCDECGVQEVNWQLCWWEARGRERPHSWCERGPKVAFRTYCRQHLPAPREVSEGQRVAELEARRAELRAQALAERPPASPEAQAAFQAALAQAGGDHVKAAASLVAHLTGQMTAPGAGAGAPLPEPDAEEFDRRKRRAQEQAAAALRRGAARGE